VTAEIYSTKTKMITTFAPCDHKFLLDVILLCDGYDTYVSFMYCFEPVILAFFSLFNALVSAKDGSYTMECSGTGVAETCNWCCWAFSVYHPGNESKSMQSITIE